MEQKMMEQRMIEVAQRIRDATAMYTEFGDTDFSRRMVDKFWTCIAFMNDVTGKRFTVKNGKVVEVVAEEK